MSTLLAILLYLAPGAALARLRYIQGACAADAVFGGLFWPGDLFRRWVDWGACNLLGAWERGRV